MLRDLIAALDRVASVDPNEDPSAPLRACAREAARLTGAAAVVVRLPEGPLGYLEARFPEKMAWPSDPLVRRWFNRALVSHEPVRITARGPDKGRARPGLLLPIRTPTGETGVLIAFARGATPFAPPLCHALLLLGHTAAARTDAARLRIRTEALTLTDVRDYVAREIHDGPLQMLSQVLLRLRLAQRQDDQQLRTALAELEGDLKLAVGQMRALIRTLRVARPEAPLAERVRTALARLERTRGLSCTLHWREPEGVPLRVADEVFHVINEALANVYRHSLAKHVHLTGRVRSDIFEIVVRDDGIGFNVAAALRRDLRSLSFGLVHMQERMAAVGGTLALKSRAGRGTRVVLTLPVSRPALKRHPVSSGKSA